MHFQLSSHTSCLAVLINKQEADKVLYVPGISFGGREPGSRGHWGLTEPQATWGMPFPSLEDVKIDSQGKRTQKASWLKRLRKRANCNSWARPLLGPGSRKYKLAEVSTKDDNSCSHSGKGTRPEVPQPAKQGFLEQGQS